ncbi:hypothetical protein JL722_12454 [Aureococcus anophagefferens]|nr:hypothetical protein JL722_12454 [Aureococcus anophagefferens]
MVADAGAAAREPPASAADLHEDAPGPGRGARTKRAGALPSSRRQPRLDREVNVNPQIHLAEAASAAGAVPAEAWVDGCFNALHGDLGAPAWGGWDDFMSAGTAFYYDDLTPVAPPPRRGTPFVGRRYANPRDGLPMYAMFLNLPRSGSIVEFHSAALDGRLAETHFRGRSPDECEGIPTGATVPYLFRVSTLLPTNATARGGPRWPHGAVAVSETAASADGACATSRAVLSDVDGAQTVDLLLNSRATLRARDASAPAFCDAATYAAYVAGLHAASFGVDAGWDRFIDRHVGVATNATSPGRRRARAVGRAPRVRRHVLAAAALTLTAATKIKNKGSVSVQVVVRCRPLNKKEITEERTPIIEVDATRVHITKTIGNGGMALTKDEQLAQKKQFTFDACYDEKSTQKQFYEESCYPLVESVMEGFNGTIFAYGQTGCGKTWTMQGPSQPKELRGVIPSSFDHIFENIRVSKGVEYLVRCSYLEIYNEEIRDLLGNDPKARCELKEDPSRGVYVKGLSNVVVQDEATINRVMDTGLENRTTGATLMNEGSSRSHSIFTTGSAATRRRSWSRRSPADYNYDETLSTLRYANRAKNIKNKPKINEDPKDAMLREYKSEIDRLKQLLEAQQHAAAAGPGVALGRRRRPGGAVSLSAAMVGTTGRRRWPRRRDGAVAAPGEVQRVEVVKHVPGETKVQEIEDLTAEFQREREAHLDALREANREAQLWRQVSGSETPGLPLGSARDVDYGERPSSRPGSRPSTKDRERERKREERRAARRDAKRREREERRASKGAGADDADAGLPPTWDQGFEPKPEKQRRSKKEPSLAAAREGNFDVAF